MKGTTKRTRMTKDVKHKIHDLFNKGHHTGSIAKALHIAEFQVVKALQLDLMQRRVEFGNRRRR